VAETTEIASPRQVQSGVAGFKGFLGEVKVEMQKCTWPTKTELKEQTLVVVVSVLLLAAVVWVSDMILMAITGVIF